MMRRLELLPESYQAERRQRRNIASVVAAGVVVLAVLLGYWLLLGVRIASAERELARETARNEALQADIASLQRFAELEQEVAAKRAALVTVMKGDVDWPSVLTEIAMVIPGEVWLRSLTASAGTTEGATTVGTETAPVRINPEQPFGRMQFQGTSLSMSGVAKWMLRFGAVKEFDALWLNAASETELGEGVPVVDFDATLELNDEASSRRFQEQLP